MLYGILLESARDGICLGYGNQIWKKIVQELNFEHESFTTLGRYEDNLIERIAECKRLFFYEKFVMIFYK
jgi:hypothetical protein